MNTFKDVRPTNLLKGIARPFVPCPCCKNKGFTLLTAPMWETLKALDKLGFANAEEVHQKLKRPDIGTTAISNRLLALKKAGFAWRHKQGKAYFYRLIVPNHWPEGYSPSPAGSPRTS